MKDFGLHNAVALLLLIGSIIGIVGFGRLAGKIADTWQPHHTTLLIVAGALACVGGVALLGALFGGGIAIFSRRFGGGNNYPAPPEGFQVIDQPKALPTHEAMPMLLDVDDDKAGEFSAIQQVEDAWS